MQKKGVVGFLVLLTSLLSMQGYASKDLHTSAHHTEQDNTPDQRTEILRKLKLECKK